MLARTIAAAVLAAGAAAAAGEGGDGGGRIVLPDDPIVVVDVGRDCGAVGDGRADDTDAIQAAIERIADHKATRFVYFPAGTYRITRPVVFRKPGGRSSGSMVGPWLYGEDRDRTVIRLADGAEGFADASRPRAAIRGLNRPDGSRMNADFFDRTVANLTIDTGDNPGAVGIKYYSNNTGLLRRVVVRGNGACGIDLGFNDQNGPHLIQDVAVEGFATGIRTGHILNSQTLSRVAIRNCREVGLHHRGQVLAVEALTVTGTPAPIRCENRGVLAIVDSRLEAPGAGARRAGAAVTVSKSTLYAARLATRGFARAIADGEGGADGPTVAEYASAPPVALGDAPAAGLGMKPPPEPVVPLPDDADEWVCANDYGAKPGDKGDDAEAIQRAVDAAAKKGATTVYLRGGKRGDPNWYWMRRNVRIHGSVRRIMGIGHIRILGGARKDPAYPENLAKFVVGDDPGGARVVAFEHLHVFSPWPAFGIEARSPGRTVVCRTTSGGTVIARKGTTVFLTNCVGHCYQEPGSTVWARQWNTEHGPEAVGVNTRNDGGRLWVLGMKTEAASTKLATLNGGRTEVLGVHNYNTRGLRDDTPFFLVEDAAMSVAGYREVCFVGKWWRVPVLLRLGGRTLKHPGAKWQTWSLLRAGTQPPRTQ